MRARQLIEAGIPHELLDTARRSVIDAAQAGIKKRALKDAVASVVASPEDSLRNPYFGPLAEALVSYRQREAARAAAGPFRRRDEPAPWRQWGADLDPKSIEQMENACALPVSVRGALMADAHVGYGLPIGGILATENAVIPYAVGVDIACRVKMTVLDLPITHIEKRVDRLTKALEAETRFGIGAKFQQHRRHHEVMDRDWSVSPVTKKNKDKAWAQLGTSGSGNHFVDYGVLTIERDNLGLEPGDYFAILSHSGSRGTGAAVCSHYSAIARAEHPDLPKYLKHLAWLDLDSQEGHEYWLAMNLMGEYAAANHACIHRHLAQNLGGEVLLDVENHHNFAWKEVHDGRELIVHRKGATPAAQGVLGIIPGTMASSAYIVRGLGNPDSLESAAHGAGRVMSRKAAKNTFNWKQANELLTQKRVHLISAGLDEVPMVYKDINEVMAAQSDLVEPLARFTPRIVKMAPAGERPED